MKKVLFTFFVIFLFPLGVFAYSKYIIPGGESIGIKINTEGLVVVGFYKVEDEYIAKNNFKIGDKIRVKCIAASKEDGTVDFMPVRK